jgi:hypothetical protein
MNNGHSIPISGTIIVDACSLIRLGVESGATNGSPQTPHRYFELLQHMARQMGYQIIIPEAVAHETEEVLCSGLSAHRIFTKVNHSAGRFDHRPELHDFLMTASGGGFERITVPPTTGPAEVKPYMDALRNATVRVYTDNNLPDIATELRAIPPRFQAEFEKQGGTAGTSFKKHFGDRAIEHLVTELSGEIGNSKIFVMSEDTEFLRGLGQRHPNISVFNTKGLIEAMVESGVVNHSFWHPACFPRNKTAATIHEDMLAKLTKTERNGNCQSATIDCDAVALAVMGKEFVNHQDLHGPLCESLRGIIKGHSTRFYRTHTNGGSHTATVTARSEDKPREKV